MTKLIPAGTLAGRLVIEVWWNDTFLGTITPSELPGIRIQSKYPVTTLDRNQIQTEIVIGEISVSTKSEERRTVITKEITHGK